MHGVAECKELSKRPECRQREELFLLCTERAEQTKSAERTEHAQFKKCMHAVAECLCRAEPTWRAKRTEH